jgi:hypothetical protein
LVYIVSFEERRVEELLQEIAQRLNKRTLVWTVTRGFVDPGPGRLEENTADPLLALDKLLKTPADVGILYVLKDFHPFLDSNQVVCIRKLRDAVYHLQSTNSSLFILSPVLRIPSELEKEITVLDFPVPTKEDLRDLLASFEREHCQQATIRLDSATREAIVNALLGLTHIEAENVLSRALINDRRLDATDLPVMIKEKEQIIRKSGILEFQPLEDHIDDVGGLDCLKEWLSQTRATFNEAAASRGVQTPRGVLLLGVPGCGKSLTAKAVAEAWQMPLLRFDARSLLCMLANRKRMCAVRFALLNPLRPVCCGSTSWRRGLPV